MELSVNWMRFRIAIETKPWVCLGEITWVVLTEVEDIL